MSETEERYFTDRERASMVSCELSETPMKTELKISGNRHARKLIKKLIAGGIDLPELAHDSIRQEFEYATLDGYRITMKHQSETEIDHDDHDRFNR